ncbi:MAG: hypothetical protein AVDCRST_MAG51-56, partial [uncultured Ramlibacter sp.]
PGWGRSTEARAGGPTAATGGAPDAGPTAEQQLAALAKQAEATQAELRTLREVIRSQSAQLQQANARADQIRDVVAGAGGALALALVLMLLWRRSRETSTSPWWQRNTAPAKPAVRDSKFVDSSYPEEAQDLEGGWSAPGPELSQMVPTPSPEAAARPNLPAFIDSVYGRSRAPSAEELLDVQEKANFFVAIGQPDQAIHLLESRLMEHLGSSPFLWMDLLDLCRNLERPADYERVRKAFQKVFPARLPTFEAARLDSGGLERYPRALSRIVLLWPSSRVLKEIEKSLFEDPEPGSIMFDLEASRELLLLYSVAHEVVTEQEDGRPYDRTELNGLDSENTTQPVSLFALDDSSPSHPRHPMLELDLDFSVAEKRKQQLAPGVAMDLDLDLDQAERAAGR